MADLLILRPCDPEGDSAPEFQYLFSYLLLQARQVFDRVEAVEVTEGGEIPAVAESPAAPEGNAVLVLGSSQILLSRRSLAAMRDRLAEGAAEVRPGRLAASPLAARRPLYTLRAFEQVEGEFLAAGSGSAPVPDSHLPVSLFAAEAFREVASTIPVHRLLREPGSLGERPGAVAAGLYHEFIDYYGEVRSDILPFLPEGVEDVLEIGCGRGATGRFLQEQLGCRVTGVELNPVVAREAARHLHRVVQGDVQTLDLDGRYQAVLGLEVVEHLVEAEAFLTRARQLLAPGGRAIFSIPNVGHYSVVEDLIAGRWDYLPVGLLCYTHYRFFTRPTLADWLRRSGALRFEIVAQKTESPERPERFLENFETDLESLSTKGFYVIVHG